MMEKRRKYTHVERLIMSSSENCFKVTGKDITGQMAWYFIWVEPMKREIFLRHKNGDSYNLEDYGRIISSGYGEEVPLDVQKMLTEKYGFDNF